MCAGCGFEASADEPYPFRCPNSGSGDGADHVMARILDPARVRFPWGDDQQPFVRYRGLLHSFHLARAHGTSDADYVALVERLNRQVAGVDGRGFVVTPFGRSAALGERLGFTSGGVWMKDETSNVSGSHKARHLMGLMIHLEVVERAGMARGDRGAPTLAIASCGNAALAAAVVARAGGRPLEVFIPTRADPKIVARLEALGARLTVCPRAEGVRGDPAYLRMQQALASGALPFTCQGPDNGLTIEGGMTLGYEIVSALARSGGRLDRLLVQVGGGALASACVQSLEDAARLGALTSLPRIHAVQTRGGYPLKRAYDRAVRTIVERRGATAESRQAADGRPAEGDRVADDHLRAGDQRLADLIRDRAASPEVAGALRHAATHRAEFMWPWEEEPRSIAHGILDDETYDWLAVVAGMIRTGGYPVVVDEATIVEANALARDATGIDVDHTGSAGLAGLVSLVRQGIVAPEENVAVLFTGIRR